MSSREMKKERKALGQKNGEEAPEVLETTKVLSKTDIERQKNLSRAQSIQIKKNDLVKDVLTRVNGEFTTEQRRLFELYLFEDKSPEETMRELRRGKKEEEQIPPDEFYRLVEKTTREMKKYISNFTF